MGRLQSLSGGFLDEFYCLAVCDLTGCSQNPFSFICQIGGTSVTHIITSLCLRDAGCVEVCPVECIVPGKPAAEWPWYYIDPDTCIDCGACIPECPFEAIFPEDEVPASFTAKAGQQVSM